MNNNFKKILGCSFAIAFGWLALFGSANAILVKGHIDPLFGGGGVASGVYWTALLEFTDADNSCLSGVDGPRDCTPDAGSLSLSATFTQGVNTEAVTFAFAPSPPTFSVDVQGGVIQAIQTGPLGPSNLFTLGSLQGFAWIDFEFGGALHFDSDSAARLLLQLCPSTTSTSRSSYYHYPPAVCSPSLELVTEFSDPAAVTVEQIPEPATALLLLGALASGWIVRRRSA